MTPRDCEGGCDLDQCQWCREARVSVFLGERLSEITSQVNAVHRLAGLLPPRIVVQYDDGTEVVYLDPADADAWTTDVRVWLEAVDR